jgi:tRNA wybutosine-synthesizing protein 2
VYPGDNRDPSLLQKLSGLADRVSLGLLPSCEDGIPVALEALKASGGVLHVHANVVSVW